MDDLQKRYKEVFARVEETANLFNMKVEALVHPEIGEGQLSEEDRFEAVKQQIKAYEKEIIKLVKLNCKAP